MTPRRTSCAAASSPATRASTAATRRPCARSTCKSACCRARTARPCSRAARRRRLVVTTLGTGRDAQIIDALEGERKDPFMLHYNFPPYSVGETGFIGSPKRREIGHGRLARRGVEAVMPDMGTFPYVIRVVSEITESNGSSSMASVCGTSLSLMDAGVPIKAPVAGVAMGLIKEDERLRGAHGHPRRRGSPRRHGLQGRRHGRRRHRAPDGHQDLRHHARDHGTRRSRRRATGASTSSAR